MLSSQDTIWLYHRWDGYDFVTPISTYHLRAEFRTVRWCTTHDSNQNEKPYCDYDRFLSLIHDSPGPECVFVDKLVEV